MKKSWLLCFLVVATCLGFSVSVKADFNAGIVIDDTAIYCKNGFLCGTNQPKLGTTKLGDFLSGFRVSITTDNGSRLGGTTSVDYINSSAQLAEVTGATNIIYYNQKFTRQEIVGSYLYYAERSTSNSGYDALLANCGGECTQLNLHSYIEKLNSEAEAALKNAKTAEEYVQKFNGTKLGQYAVSAGYDVSKYLTCTADGKCEYQQHYIQFEPLVKTRITKNKRMKFFVGTVTETYGLATYFIGSTDQTKSLADATAKGRDFGNGPGYVVITTYQDFKPGMNTVAGMLPYSGSTAYEEIYNSNMGVAMGAIWVGALFTPPAPCTDCESCLKEASTNLTNCLTGKGLNASSVVTQMLKQLSGTVYPFQPYTASYFGYNGQAAADCANEYIAKKNELALKYPNNVACNPIKKPEICDVNNPLHFVGGLNANNGPNGENCCQYFIDLYQNNTYQLENFYTRYPQCDNRPKCDPEIQTPGYCEMDGKYKESEDWQNCIYKKEEYRERNLELDSSICSVYCREDFNTLFPGNYTTVPAGQHFVWEPIKVSGERECRTKEIDLEKWKQRWSNYNDALPRQYNEWQIALKKQESIDDALRRGVPSTQCSCIENWGGFTCCIAGHTVQRTCRTKDCDTEGKCTWVSYDCSYDVCDAYDRSTSNRYTLYTPYGFNYDGGYYKVNKWCSDESQPDPNEPYYNNRYHTTLANKNYLEQGLNKCNTWQADYELKTKIQLQYEYLDNDRSIPLDKSNGPSSDKKTYCKDYPGGYCVSNMYGTMTSENYLKSYNCTTEGCHLTTSNYYTYKMPNNRYIMEDIKKSNNYSLPDYVWRYTLKPSGVSVDDGQVPQENLDHGLYFDIGYGNLPVYFETPSGDYPISLKYTYLGGRGQFDRFVDSQYIKDGDFYYECSYHVNNCIIGEDCPENPDNPGPGPGPGPGGDPDDPLKGIKVVYRPIDLNNPFPGLSGDGRIEGSNWSTTDYNGNGVSDAIDDYITNNRGVQTTEVYNKQPMFEFVLSPSDIRNIRDYNKTRLTEGNYADFGLICREGVDCESSFLRSNTSLGRYFSSASGTCYDYTNGSTFFSCQLEG